MEKLNKEEIINLLKINKVGFYLYSENIIQVNCPYCRSKKTGEKDSEYHCGIFINSNKFSCFRCRKKGVFSFLFYGMTGNKLEIESETKNKEGSLLETVKKTLDHPTVVKTRKKKSKIVVPGEPLSLRLLEYEPTLDKFLNNRNIDINTAIEHEARWGGKVGEYAYRIILPVYENGVIVNFQARDVTENAKNKYDGPKESLGNYLYHLDGNDNWRYIVEGIFDAWRIGKNVIATFGLGMTDVQKRKLLEYPNIDEIVVAYDYGAESASMKLCSWLRPFFLHAGFVKFECGEDPDSVGNVLHKREIIWLS